jgi:hypothetical protein
VLVHGNTKLIFSVKHIAFKRVRVIIIIIKKGSNINTIDVIPHVSKNNNCARAIHTFYLALSAQIKKKLIIIKKNRK